jgi:hypothetical protein
MWPLIIPIISKVIDLIIPDKKQQADIKLKMMELEFQKQFKEIELQFERDSKQIDVNVEEAKSSSLFIAGWRPAVGWICVIALGYHYILAPFMADIAGFLGYAVKLTELNISELMTLLFGLLGLGAFRTYEKVKGVDKKKFFDVLRQQPGIKSLSQKDVDALENALDEATPDRV